MEEYEVLVFNINVQLETLKEKIKDIRDDNRIDDEKKEAFFKTFNKGLDLMEKEVDKYL